MYPVIYKYTRCLLDSNNCDNIIKSLNMIQPSDDPLFATLAIDAAKFKNIKGKEIKSSLKKCILLDRNNSNFFLKYIDDEIIYKNIFIFHVQPVNKDIKPFPIYARFSTSGSADEDIYKAFVDIQKNLLKYNIIIKFCATDGDHYYDYFHDIFFDKIFPLIKQKKSFSEIIDIISEDFLENDEIIPISDFLHSIKLLRSYFLEGKINLDILSNINVVPSEMDKYELGNVISDDSSLGKMKDAYPLYMFSNDTLNKAISFKDYHILFFLFPFNLLIECIRNPNLSIQCRLFLLDISFQFLIFHLFQKNYNKNSIHSRIGIERIINTIIGLGVSLKVFQFIKLSHISSHPLENLFGMIRLSCSYNHSSINMVQALGRAFYLKLIIDNQSIDIRRRERISIAGVAATRDLEDGEISLYSPFQLFIILWANMKQYKSLEKNLDISPFLQWFQNFKKMEWNEKVYSPSKLSGNSISSRYKCEKERDALIVSKERKKQAKKVKNQAKEINDQKKIETRSYLNEFEQKALSLNNIYDFMELLYDKPIKGYEKKLKDQLLKYDLKKKKTNQ